MPCRGTMFAHTLWHGAVHPHTNTLPLFLAWGGQTPHREGGMRLDAGRGTRFAFAFHTLSSLLSEYDTTLHHPEGTLPRPGIRVWLGPRLQFLLC